MAAREAVRLWAGTELRRRWRPLVALGVIAGMAAGLALAAAAGARRTASVYTRYRDATDAPDALVFATQLGVVDQDYSAVRRLPEVVDAGMFELAPVGLERPKIGTLAPGDDHLYRTLARPLLVAGRLPDPARDDEIVVNRLAARQHHLRVGQRVTLTSALDLAYFFNGQPPAGGPRVAATVVGIGDSPLDPIFFSEEAAFVPGAGFLSRHPEVPRSPNLVVRLRPGTDVNAFHRRVAAALGLPDIPVRDLGEDRKRIVHGTDLERTGLLLFAAAAAVAGVVLVGQALARAVYAQGESGGALRALGFTGRELVTGLVAPHVVTAATAAVVAVGAAVAVSGRFPVGLGRRLEPDPGLHADWTVLAPGALAVAATVVAGAALAARRAIRREPDAVPDSGSSLVRSIGRAAPVPVAIGAGLALEPRRNGRSLPVLPALVGAVVGVVGVVGAMGLVRGIDDALARPARSGQVWDAVVVPTDEWNGEALLDALRHQPDAAGLAAIRLVPLDVDGHGLPSYSLDRLRGGLSFVVQRGRAPRGPGEVALGPSTAKALGKGIGDTVELAGDQGRRRSRVVGIAFLPQTPHAEFDQGVWTAGATQTRLASIRDDGDDVEVLVRARSGVAPAALLARLRHKFGEVEAASPPQDVSLLRNVRTLPRVLAVFLVLLALAALGHALGTTVRRRRHDLAVLRAIGFRPGQNAVCIVSQATTVALVGLLVGIPLGVAAGQVAWRWVAEATPLLYVAPLALVVALLAVPAALLIAGLLSALPARRAARMRPAEVLRAE
ncbi:MAG TPA: ABC transporter permease [Acidimicrobiales bacterium]|nr:ABC transporter permease [Acidimicrobiales bacterium]